MCEWVLDGLMEVGSLHIFNTQMNLTWIRTMIHTYEHPHDSALTYLSTSF